MVVRPGRLLPSVIVGALVTGALALGAGTAVAAGTCVLGLQSFPIGGAISEDSDGKCLLGGQTPSLSDLLAYLAGREEDSGSGGESGSGESGGEDDGGEGSTPVIVVPVPQVPIDTGGDEGEGDGKDTETTEPTTPSTPTSNQNSGGGGSFLAQSRPVIQSSSALPAPDVRGGVVPNADLLSPGAAYGGLAATTPALGFGTFDPSLLLAPAGSPLRTLTGVDQGSPVTTVSDVQAMAFDNLPGGLGMPAVTGTLILSAFAAFALRHRVLRRARMAADTDAGSEVDTAEIPAREPVG